MPVVAQIERFLDLTFLAVRRDAVKGTKSRHKKTPLCIQQQEPPLGKESITRRSEAGFRARGRNKRMTGAGNQEHG
jgi:hypothetical protein